MEDSDFFKKSVVTSITGKWSEYECFTLLFERRLGEMPLHTHSIPPLIASPGWVAWRKAGHAALLPFSSFHRLPSVSLTFFGLLDGQGALCRGRRLAFRSGQVRCPGFLRSGLICGQGDLWSRRSSFEVRHRREEVFNTSGFPPAETSSSGRFSCPGARLLLLPEEAGL